MKYFMTWAVLVLGLYAFAPAALAQGASTAEQNFEALPESQRKQFVAFIEGGLEAYERGEFERALRFFTDAYDIFGHPDILYRIALTHERLGQDGPALRFYRQFLEEVPDAEERGRIENTMRVIEERLAAMASKMRIITEPSGARVYINDIANGVAGTTPTELPMNAAQYKVIVRYEGYESIEELIEVPRGQTVVLRYVLKPLAREVERPSLVPAVGAGVIAVGATVLSPIYFTRVFRLDEEIQYNLDTVARHEGGEERHRTLTREREQYLTRGWISAGVAVIGWGAAIYFVDRSVSGGSAAIKAQPAWELGMTDGGVQLRWSTAF